VFKPHNFELNTPRHRLDGYWGSNLIAVKVICTDWIAEILISSPPSPPCLVFAPQKSIPENVSKA